MDMTKREVLTSAVAAAGSLILSSGKTAAQERREKPLFTPNNVNRIMNEAKREKTYPKIVQEAVPDLKKFISNRFQLTKTQAQILEAMTQQQVDLINRALQNGIEVGAVPRLEIGVIDDSKVPAPPGFLDIVIVVSDPVSTERTLEFSVTVERKKKTNEEVEEEIKLLSRSR